MRPVFLLPLRVGSHPLWMRQLSGALATAAAADPLSRVMLLLLAEQPAAVHVRDELSDQLVSLLSRAYDCIPTHAPRLDLVPVLAAGGWRLEQAATHRQLSALLKPPIEGESSLPDACVEDAIRRIREARHQAGLAELPFCIAGCLGELPLSSDASSMKVLGGNPCASRRLVHEHVAVGGTFDRLHAGHRLLLAVAALACTRVCYVGVTGDKLLANKAHADLLHTYEHRSLVAKEYLQAVRPALGVELSALLDPSAPPKAATMAEITALVISRETVAGGVKLQQMRRDQGIEEPLDLILVDLVGASSQSAGASKLSSSELRRLDATAPTQTFPL